MTGAFPVACIAEFTSFSPLPVFNTTTGSSGSIKPSWTALINPAYDVDPAGSAKIPTFPNSVIALTIASSETVIYAPPVWVAALNARKPSRGRSTEILSAKVFAETGMEFFQHLVKGKPGVADFHLAGFNFRYVNDVIDQGHQLIARILDQADVVVAFVVV